MNGGEQAIMNKIIEIETKQEERHDQNKGDLEYTKEALVSIFKKLNKLPCEVHIERMSGFRVALGFLFVCVAGLAGWMVLTHFSG